MITNNTIARIQNNAEKIKANNKVLAQLTEKQRIANQIHQDLNDSLPRIVGDEPIEELQALYDFLNQELIRSRIDNPGVARMDIANIKSKIKGILISRQ
jgi:flagellin-specific chaperone FliS